MVAAGRLPAIDGELAKGLFFSPHVLVQIYLRGFRRLVPEPHRNDVDVDARLEQLAVSYPRSNKLVD